MTEPEETLVPDPRSVQTPAEIAEERARALLGLGKPPEVKRPLTDDEVAQKES